MRNCGICEMKVTGQLELLREEQVEFGGGLSPRSRWSRLGSGGRPRALVRSRGQIPQLRNCGICEMEITGQLDFVRAEEGGATAAASPP